MPEWAGKLCPDHARAVVGTLLAAYDPDVPDDTVGLALATCAYAILSAQLAPHGVDRAIAVGGRLPPWVADNL